MGPAEVLMKKELKPRYPDLLWVCLSPAEVLMKKELKLRRALMICAYLRPAEVLMKKELKRSPQLASQAAAASGRSPDEEGTETSTMANDYSA